MGARESRRRTWWIVAWSIVVPGTALPRDAAGQWRAEPVLGVRFGPPLRASGVLGIGYGTESSIAQFAGPMILGELGLGGARASAGYLFAEPFVAGASLAGTIVRTWHDPSQVAPNRWLVGGEVHVMFFAFNVGFGVYRPVSAPARERRTRYFLNAGLGV